MPDVRDLYKRLQRKGLAVIGVVFEDSAEIARRAAKEHKLDWRQVCDGKRHKGPLCTPFNVRGIPDCLIFGRNGKLRGRGSRGLELIRLVENLIKERPPKRNQ